LLRTIAFLGSPDSTIAVVKPSSSESITVIAPTVIITAAKVASVEVLRARRLRSVYEKSMSLPGRLEME
jgi:hypothetical protein